METKFPTIGFYKVDIDTAKDVAKKFGVKTGPKFEFYLNGKLVDYVEGVNEDKVHQKLIVFFHGTWKESKSSLSKAQ